MLILKEKEIYLIDRDNNVFAAPQFHFPQRKFPREHVFDTLLDGVSPSCLFLKKSEWTDLILSCSDHELHLTCHIGKIRYMFWAGTVLEAG